MGATAVGKSECIAKLYREGVLHSAEVIVADSAQCYRHIKIGNAAPTAELCRQVPHHLVNFFPPNCQYTVADFVHRAENIIAQLHSRGRLPVISGGCGYYLLRLLCGLPQTPPADRQIRYSLQQRLKREGSAVLYQELTTYDACYAARIAPQDCYRILRALEIIAVSGCSPSQYPLKEQPRRDWNILSIGLSRATSELRALVTARVNAMFQSGLVKELHWLLQQGYDPTDAALQTIGYRQFFNNDGTLRNYSDPTTLNIIQQEIIRATLKYAKRQRTFFRKFHNVSWYSPTDYKVIATHIRSFLANTSSPGINPPL